MKRLIAVLTIVSFVFILGIFLVVNVGFASAAANPLQNPTICCEKTISGLYCQDVPSNQCAPDAKQVPTSCRATTYCKPGTCFDSNQGTCLDNTPQSVCNQNKGIWTDNPAPQCELGCCVLGDQAAFVTQTRCKKLSADLGLETNYKKEIKNEASCIASVLGQEKGACVFESEFQKTCRMTTRAECAGGFSGNLTKGTFFKGKLCSAEELGTNCGPTEKTTCAPGKEEVYFVDSCGNTANIYDSTKSNDKEYWSDIKDKSESCNAESANADDKNCGNCNYIQGSICRATSSSTAKPKLGANICADLNCKKTSNGKGYKHGESWCVNSDPLNSVGSGFYKHICINGEEVLEACADFRQNICIEGTISYAGGTFSQAACRVNRWQECTAQGSKEDCENDDKRECKWLDNSCVPKVSPGLKFWEGEEASAICGQASTICTATKKTDIFGNDDWEGDCVDSKGNTAPAWVNQKGQVCHALGDCVATTDANLVADKKLNWLKDKSKNGA